MNKMKRQYMGWEEIFANQKLDYGLMPKIYKELNSKKEKLKMNQNSE